MSAVRTVAASEAGSRPSFPDILAPFVPTPHEVVDRMLRLAQVGPRDVVCDLGSGDGRIVIAAAKTYGARGVGVDAEPYRVAEAQANAVAAGVEHLVEFHLGDAQSFDCSRATVVTLYLVGWSTARFQPILGRTLGPGARIVSHSFALGDWRPDKVEKFTDGEGKARTLFLWVKT